MILALHHLLAALLGQHAIINISIATSALSNATAADWLGQAVFNRTVGTLPLVLIELLVGKENARLDIGTGGAGLPSAHTSIRVRHIDSLLSLAHLVVDAAASASGLLS